MFPTLPLQKNPLMSFSLSSSDMGTLCSDQQVQQHKFHPSHQLYFNKKTLREIDIPPRKLLSRRAAAAASGVLHLDSDMFMDSPKGCVDEALLQKFLPYNNINDDDGGDDDADPYSSDHFRMYEFKVRKCTRSRSHDWTDCPFAHPGEKARRRDPRRYHYTGTVCAEFRRGSCSRGDNCEFAHGVFECWLHPSRYRTEACKDGKNCKRKVCFFAHTPRQLRVLPANCLENASSPMNSPVALEKKHRNVNHCCVYCHSVAVSPTSTLMGISHLSPPMSPSLSPPLSPVNTAARFSPVSRYKDHFVNMEACRYPQFNSSPLSYKDALTELMSSLEAMQVNESSSSHHSGNLQWLDVNFNGDHDQHQFLLSPSTPSPGSSKFLHGNFPTKNSTEEYKYNDIGLAGPDLGWVNDLLT